MHSGLNSHDELAVRRAIGTGALGLDGVFFCATGFNNGFNAAVHECTPVSGRGHKHTAFHSYCSISMCNGTESWETVEIIRLPGVKVHLPPGLIVLSVFAAAAAVSQFACLQFCGYPSCFYRSGLQT
jgi:hypothetical protein